MSSPQVTHDTNNRSSQCSLHPSGTSVSLPITNESLKSLSRRSPRPLCRRSSSPLVNTNGRQFVIDEMNDGSYESSDGIMEEESGDEEEASDLPARVSHSQTELEYYKRSNSSHRTSHPHSSAVSNSSDGGITESFSSSHRGFGNHDGSISNRHGVRHVYRHNYHRPQKPRKTAWYHALTSSYKSKCETFKKIFCDDEVENEWLLVDYACAFLKRNSGLLMQGRMYITERRICFYSKILAMETKLILWLRDISAITKERTAMVIPNAIQMVMKSHEKHFFTSFASRDRAISIIHKVWSNDLNELVFSSEEFWEQVHEYYGDDLGLTTSDDEGHFARQLQNEGTSNDLENVITPHRVQSTIVLTNHVRTDSPRSNRWSDPAIVPDVGKLSMKGDAESLDDKFEVTLKRNPSSFTSNTIETTSTETTIAENVSTDQYGCHSHYHFEDELINIVLDVSVDTLWNMLFSADSAFYQAFARNQGHTQFKNSPWDALTPEESNTSLTNSTGSTASNKSKQTEYPALAVVTHYAEPSHFTYWRLLEYSVSFYFTSFSIQEFQRQVSCSVPGESYVVVAKVVQRNNLVPADFFTEAVYCLLAVDQRRSRLRVTHFVNNQSSGRMIRTVVSAAQKEARKHFTNLHNSLLDYVKMQARTSDGQPTEVEEPRSTPTKSNLRNRRPHSSKRPSVSSYAEDRNGMKIARKCSVSKSSELEEDMMDSVVLDQFPSGVHNHASLIEPANRHPFLYVRNWWMALSKRTTLLFVFMTLVLCGVHYYLNSMLGDSEKLNERFISLLDQIEQRRHLSTKDALQVNVRQLSSLTLKTTETWSQLLQQRHGLNLAEMKRWKFVLDHTIRVINEMLSTLIEMRDTVDRWIVEDSIPNEQQPP